MPDRRHPYDSQPETSTDRIVKLGGLTTVIGFLSVLLALLVHSLDLRNKVALTSCTCPAAVRCPQNAPQPRMVQISRLPMPFGPDDGSGRSERATFGGPIGPDGKTEVTCDLAVSQRMHNTGGLGPMGPGTGAGLCVFTSIAHAARWQHVMALAEFQEYMKHFPGGGYPEKVDEYVQKFCAKQGLPVPAYVQYSGQDPAVLDKAIRNGMMPAVTYGFDERYHRSFIAHMTNLVHLDPPDKPGALACVLDNNFPYDEQHQDTQLAWMSRDEFLRRWKLGGNGGWCVVLISDPPSPVPHN